MRRFFVCLLTFVFLVFPVQVFATETDVEDFLIESEYAGEDDSGPIMYATPPVALKWSDAYQCVVPDVDDEFNYVAVLNSSYGSGYAYLIYSDGPIGISHVKKTSGYEISLKGTSYYYYKTNASTAFNILFSEDTEALPLTFSASSNIPYVLKSLGSLTVEYINHDYEYYEYSDDSTVLKAKVWPVAVSSGSDYDAFVSLIRGVWEKLYNVKIGNLFGFEVSAVAVMVGPFFIVIACGFVNKIFGLTLETGGFGVRMANNHISRKRREREAAARSNKD